MAGKDVQGMLVRIEATTQQLRQELTRAEQAVGRSSQQMDSRLGRVDSAFDRLNDSSSRFGPLFLSSSQGVIGNLNGIERAALGTEGAFQKMLGAFTAGAALSKFLKETVAAEQEQAQLASVLRSTGEAAGFSQQKLNDMAASLAASSTLSTGQINVAQTTLLAFTGIVGNEFVRAQQAAADMAARTGMSIQQTAETIGRALDVPSEGMAALSRQGFRFSEDQKALMAELEATGRTAEAQGIIFDALEESYGGAAQAARDTLGGALTALNNTLGGLATGGEGSLSGVTKLVNALNAALSSPEAKIAVDALGVSATALAAILVSRLAASAAASGVSFVIAQREAARYQMTLAAMSGVSGTAAASQLALGTATRVASGAMALMGGPVGLITLAGAALLYFATSADDAAEKTANLKSETDLLGQSLDNLTQAQAAKALQDVNDKLQALGSDALDAERKVERLTNNLRSFPDHKKAEEWARELVVARADADNLAISIGNLNQRASLLAQIMNQASPVPLIDAASKSYTELSGKIEQQIALIGKRTEAERFSALAAIGAHKDMSDAEKSRILTLYEQYDAAKKADDEEQERLRKKALGLKSVGNARSKAASETERAAKQTAEAIQRELDAIDRAAAVWGMTAEQVKLYDLAAQGASKSQLAHAKTTLAATAAKETQKKAEEESRKALKAVNDQLAQYEDRLTPAVALTRKYTEERKQLNAIIVKGGEAAERARPLLAKLDAEYERSKVALTQWGQWTESSLERVDGAFADTWRNIDKGFAGFKDGLLNSFKQMLAELAHMAITKPIVFSLGASLGIGSAQSALAGVSGSGGGMGLFDIFSAGKNAYSLGTSGFGSAVSAGWQAGEGFLGGLQGALSGGSSYLSSGISGLFSGTSSAATGTGFGLGQNVVSGGVGSASYATSSGFLGSGLSGAGAGLAGVGGALYGYSQSGWKGAATGAAGSVAGAVLGNMILPGIGGLLGGALGGMIGGSLFGGDWITKDTGLQLGVSGGDLDAYSYEYQKKKGGLFGKNKKRTKLNALDETMQAALDTAYEQTESAVEHLFKSLSIELNDGVLDGLTLGAQQISTKGKTEEQIQEEIAKWFADVADAMTGAIDSATGAGLEGYTFEGLTAFVNNLNVVNEAVRYLNVTMYDASVAGGKFAEQMTGLFGGIDNLLAGTGAYYQGFFTEAERADDMLDAVTRAFEAANQELPETREQYRKMVEAIDITSDADQAMFATLMSLSGQAVQYFDILEQRSASAIAGQAELLFGVVDSAYSALQRSISAQQKALQQQQQALAKEQQAVNKELGATSARVNELRTLSTSLDRALKQLTGSSDQAAGIFRDQAKATLQSALAIAKAGGSLSGFEGLNDALSTLTSNDETAYETLTDFARDQGQTAIAVDALNKLTGKQLTEAERTLRTLEAQLAAIEQQSERLDAQKEALDAQLDAARMQLDALNGIDNSVKSVADAIRALNSAIVASLQAKPAGSAQANTPANNASIVDTIYKSVLGRDADKEGAAFWAKALQNGTASYQDITASIAKGALGNSAESSASKKSAEEYLKSMGIPGFAAGGVHSGGIRLVGERGPELEVTGPSRIINNSDLMAGLRGGSEKGWQEVVAAVSELRGYLFQITKNTGTAAQELRQQNDAGLVIQS